MNAYIQKIWETIDSKASLSNMRFNVTCVTFTICFCLTIMTIVMCYMLYKEKISGSEMTAWAVILIGYGGLALGYKNAQAKTEQKNSVINEEKKDLGSETA